MNPTSFCYRPTPPSTQSADCTIAEGGQAVCAPVHTELTAQAGCYAADLATLLRWEAERLEQAGGCFFDQMGALAAARRRSLGEAV